MAEEKPITKPKKTKSSAIGAQAKPTTIDKTISLDIDTEKALVDSVIEAGLSSGLNVGELENFTNISNSREQMYMMIDTMAADSTVSSIIRTYTEDACEVADNGHIVWCESADPHISMFVNYLLNTMNVDKNIYNWTYNLIKYGDVYLKLFRESDYKDALFSKDKVDTAYNAATSSHTRLNESSKETLEEQVNLNIHTVSDPYSYYVEMVPNPGTMFELTKFGKTYGYIETPDDKSTNTYLNSYIGSTSLAYNGYKMKSNDVNIYQADDYVHACLEDNFTRYPETVDIFMTDKDFNNSTNSQSYTVRRGKSMLLDSYKIWREKSLLETAALMNRLTKSSLVRNIQVEVGDMPKSQVQSTLRKIKELFDQKAAFNTGTSMQDYTNPGPIENNIFTAVHNGQGAITIAETGGDIDVKNLADLDWWNNKFFAAYGIPKQFFGYCLSKDTQILLLDGTKHTIEELYNNKELYLNKGIMGCNSDGSLCPTKITNIVLTNKHAKLLRVWLDNDEYVDVTPDHRMMLRDGTFIEAKKLQEGDSLMPYYEKIKDGRRYVLDNKEGKFKAQYQVVADKMGIPVESGHNIHHKDKNKCNDDFTNLEKLTVDEHCKIHNLDLVTLHKKAVRCLDCGAIFDKKLNAHEYEEYLQKSRFHFCCPEHRHAHDSSGKLARSYKLYLAAKCDGKSYEYMRTHSDERADTFLKYSTLEHKLKLIEDYVPEVNHKVVKIEKLSSDNVVYDLTVADECHTFALPCGIFVHNCDDGAGFNGGTSLSIISSTYSKGVKRIQNAIIQALTDVINLFLLNRGCQSYLNNFVLKMKTPLSQEEKDYREDLSNRINAISNMQSLFADVEDKERKLKILKTLVSTLNYGDNLTQILDEEIEATKKAREAEAAETESADTTEEASVAKDAEEPADDLGLSSDAGEATEAFSSSADQTQLLEKVDNFMLEEDLPTPEEIDKSKDFTKNN